MTEAEKNILQFYQNRGLVFQALVEEEINFHEKRLTFLKQALETSRKMDEVFGQPPVDGAITTLIQRVRQMVPGLEDVPDKELFARIQQNPEYLNNVKA